MTRRPEQQDPPRGSTRREFIKTAALVAGAAGTFAVPIRTRAQDKGMLKEGSAKGLALSAAGYRLRRLEALFDGRVKIEGCDARFEEMSIGNMNTHVFSGPQTLGVTEIGLHPFMLAYANADFRAYTLLPIFPLRVFRHKSVFIRTDRGIEKPEDLKGKTIATPGYSSTSLTWIRGIFPEEYGVSPQDIQWISSSKDSSAKLAGTASKQEQIMPEEVSIKTGPEGKDESSMLFFTPPSRERMLRVTRTWRDSFPTIAQSNEPIFPRPASSRSCTL
jgi:4,5-dihydroxyphthalate decarboxylase